MPVLFVGIGLAAGILSGLFGIGGGVLIVPALAGFAAMPIHRATGTSLAALLLPVGLFGMLEYHKAGHVDLRAAMFISGGLAVGAFLGARYAQGVSPAGLQRAFAVFLAVMAVRMWFKASS